MIQPAAFRIINCYIQTESLSFTEICERVGYPTDLGGYYIRQLVTGGYLEKTARGVYAVTAKGKQYLARSSGRQTNSANPRLLVAIVGKQGDEYVLLRRKRQPFIGIAEWVAGLVEAGEPVAIAAERVAKLRLGSAIKSLVFKGFLRRTDIYNDSIFDDKLFAVFEADLAGPLDSSLELADEILRLTEPELLGLENRSKSLLDILTLREGFIEKRFLLSPEDLASI